MDKETYDEVQSIRMAHNLRRVNLLSRRGLMTFLDLPGSKSNTARLRKQARLIVIRQPATHIAADLARAEKF
jgi:hypothetical protein